MPSSTYISVLFFVLVLVSAPVYMNSCDPEPVDEIFPAKQIRVALRGPDTVTIGWKTDSPYNQSRHTKLPRIQYHTNDRVREGTIVEGSSATYATSGSVSWFHEAVLHVNSSTTYWYIIFESSLDPYLNPHSFTSQVAAGDSRQINITIIGDVGYFNLGANGRIFDQIVNGLLSMYQITNFYLHLGDLSYADDIPEISSYPFYETTWNLFQDKMENITANKMYMTVPGNHEATCMQLYDCLCEQNDYTNITQQYRNFSAYLHRFSMPGSDSNMTFKNMWYSFDYGMAHIVVINTETDFPGAPSGPDTSLNAGNFAPNGTQLTWLAADLKDARNRSCEVPWIIVAGYRHWYGTPYLKPSSSTQLCPSCGNFDWYERLYPVNRNGTSSRKSYIEPEGPIYITVGPGGNLLDIFPPTGHGNDATAQIVKEYGFTNLKIFNSTHAELNFHESFHFQLKDNQTVIRSDPCSKTCSN